MFDLCIAQVPAIHPYYGPYLKVSPTGDGRLEFRYIDTQVSEKQWCRVVEPINAVQRFNRLVKQLCWSTLPQVRYGRRPGNRFGASAEQSFRREPGDCRGQPVRAVRAD